MEIFLQNTIHFISGAYDAENDSSGRFQWLSDHVKCVVEGAKGICFLIGESPISGTVTIITEKGKYTCVLKEKSFVQLPLLLVEKESVQEVQLYFSRQVYVIGDSRTLCFKFRRISKGILEEHGEFALDLACGKGIPKGCVSTVFTNGWLRMTAMRQAEFLRVSGLLIPPLYQREYPVLCANGKPLQNIEYKLSNVDYPLFLNCAFEGILDLADVSETMIHFSAIYPSNGARANQWYHDWYYPMQSVLPLPEKSHMRRIGSDSEEWFNFSGATFIANLEALYGKLFPDKALCESSILDWGCGCGRLLRHLVARGCQRLVGIDIDPLNLDWCKKNIPHASFDLVSPNPPTKFANDSFDLIYAHSVLTHLSECDQFLWLSEIRRILKPGGLAVLTIMGAYSASIENFTIENLLGLLNKGFLDLGWQNDGVDCQKPGYYRRIFHTLDYVFEYWQNFFSIEAVFEGFSDHQAAIVLKKEMLRNT